MNIAIICEQRTDYIEVGDKEIGIMQEIPVAYIKQNTDENDQDFELRVMQANRKYMDDDSSGYSSCSFDKYRVKTIYRIIKELS